MSFNILSRTLTRFALADIRAIHLTNVQPCCITMQVMQLSADFVARSRETDLGHGGAYPAFNSFIRHADNIRPHLGLRRHGAAY